MRLFLLMVLFMVLFRLGMRALRSLSGPSQPSSPKRPAQTDAHEMVSCSLCGTFISPQDGEQRKGRWICKNRCKDTGPLGVG